MPTYTYHLVDVFTDVPFGGNPLAVFPLADGMSDELMQKLAKELNLSETTFVLPPDDGESDFRVRIFTPKKELPMAGHPTVGTAFVLQHEGVITAPGSITFQEGVGAIPVKLTLDDKNQVVATMNQPLPTFGEVFENRAEIAEMLSITQDDLLAGYPVQEVSTGVPFVYVPIKDLATIARTELRVDLWQKLLRDKGFDEVFVFTPETVHASATVHSRMFAPGMGIAEDPATGAASGPLGAYLVEYGLAQAGELISEQGFEMGRPSTIHIGIDHDGNHYTGVRCGGNSVYMGSGTFIMA